MDKELLSPAEAKWVGAPYKTYNVGGVTHYRLSVDFAADEGRCGVVIAARSREDYFLIDIDLKKRRVYVIEHNDNAWAGSYESGVRAVREIRGHKNGYEIPESVLMSGTLKLERHLSVEVDKSGITLSIDGVIVIDKEPLIEETEPIKPYRQRMFFFGFKQDDGEAVYDNLKIETLGEGTVTLVEDGFDNEYSNCSYLGKVRGGKLIVKDTFSITSAVPAVNVGKEIMCRGY